MTTTLPPGPHSPDPAPLRRRRTRTLAAGGAVLLVAAFTQGCAGSRVMSETEFHEHLRLTQEVGEDAVRRLGMDPSATVDRREMANASCKDDLGTDSEGVTRDQPSITWAPDFASRAAYEAAVDTLRGAWSAQGLTVEDVPAPGSGEPGAGLPGVRTTSAHDIELSLRPDRYSGEPTVHADGGCVRHQGYLAEWE
ncbi:hypothetical protein [Streptomyces sp. NBC_01565]|uniref:hypothetical protein n=1 Tax=unclassified Streptomyces TaxID=2593676 RepID=UPI0022568941|nr:hypothetical protein [Streptomyces sp. NBC_01565]MCX4547084.1 hypothetical protein [Streptomyces sp. NBC_01565]